MLYQDREYVQSRWTITSFDIVLAAIGGFMGVVWDSLGITLGGYETFRFNSALIGEIYRTSSSSVYSSKPKSKEEAMTDLNEHLETSSRYKYRYSEYACSKCIISFCCCFKSARCFLWREKRFKRHE